MFFDNGDDCILIDDGSDEKHVEEKSAQAISVPSSSDETEKQTSSTKLSKSRIVLIDDEVSIKNEHLQQSGTALQPTEAANINSSCHSQTQSKHMIVFYCSTLTSVLTMMSVKCSA